MAWIQSGGVAGSPKPGVIVIHGTNWNAGYAGQVQRETQDLADAGFFAAAVWYELAPNMFSNEGYIPGALHSFHYWGSWDHLPTQTQHTVGDDVIAFLQFQAGL